MNTVFLLNPFDTGFAAILVKGSGDIHDLLKQFKDHYDYPIINKKFSMWSSEYTQFIQAKKDSLDRMKKDELLGTYLPDLFAQWLIREHGFENVKYEMVDVK